MFVNHRNIEGDEGITKKNFATKITQNKIMDAR
jgi:hypothetical protein